jgi:hypothetical protein
LKEIGKNLFFYKKILLVHMTVFIHSRLRTYDAIGGEILPGSKLKSTMVARLAYLRPLSLPERI